MEKLKACPFCGNMPWVDRLRDGWSIACDSKKCPMEVYADSFTSKNEAIKAWNTRTPPDKE